MVEYESASSRYHVCQFYVKQIALIFSAQIWPKIDFGSEFQKAKFGFGICTSKIPCVLIFSQNGKFEFFGLNLGKLPNYMQYFGSNNVEGVVGNWVEAAMRWLEVDQAGWRWVHGLVIPGNLGQILSIVIVQR